MKNIKVAGQHFIYMIVALALLLSLVMPVIASAAQVTERSVALSNVSASSENVSYEFNFTAVGAAGAFVVDFCSNTPVMSQDCTAPTGFDATSASSTTTGFTDVTGSTNRVVVAGAIASSANVSVVVNNIDNPTVDGVLYARIVTFADKTSATSSTPTNLANSIDRGSVAISITPTIGVSGVVMETMTFCVSGETIGADCTGTTAPVIELGEPTGGGDVALTPGTRSEGSVFTQISTNAATGAVVRLKSSAAGCGGLLRAGDLEACDIAPALDQDIAADDSEAKFGVKTSSATATDGVTNATGQLVPATGSFYGNSIFAMNYVTGEETGVTSTYGDPFLDTAGAPVNNQNMELVFGATVNNNTPAGIYSANLSLIAVGKF